MKTTLLILLLTGGAALAQVARPTFNPFMNNGMSTPLYGANQMQQFGQRPNYNYQRPNNGFQNNYQRPNNGFQNNGFQNNGFQNNGFQQQGSAQTNTVPLFIRKFYLNNGYLYGRATLYYDPKSGAFQPWVRRNLR